MCGVDHFKNASLDRHQNVEGLNLLLFCLVLYIFISSLFLWFGFGWRLDFWYLHLNSKYPTFCCFRWLEYIVIACKLSHKLMVNNTILPRYDWNIVESGVKYRNPNPKRIIQNRCSWPRNHILYLTHLF